MLPRDNAIAGGRAAPEGFTGRRSSVDVNGHHLSASQPSLHGAALPSPPGLLGQEGGGTPCAVPSHHTPIRVYAMLPLDTVNENSVFTVASSAWFRKALALLAASGVHGVAVDVWWGAVERSPGVYTWTGYQQLLELVKSAGLRVQAVMSFHACGGNIGDTAHIGLPPWVLKCGEQDPDLFYTDRPRGGPGHRNKEYISVWASEERLLCGRTAYECYEGFMTAFRDAFAQDLGTVIEEVVIGAGPCGELRYPSYPEAHGWKFPGIGEFQCYDRRALASLAAAAAQAGRPSWGYSGPHDAGNYNSTPEETGFFAYSGSWDTAYGWFFLSWYSGCLIRHGERLLQLASRTFAGLTASSVHSGGGGASRHNSSGHRRGTAPPQTPPLLSRGGMQGGYASSDASAEQGLPAVARAAAQHGSAAAASGSPSTGSSASALTPLARQPCAEGASGADGINGRGCVPPPPQLQRAGSASPTLAAAALAPDDGVVVGVSGGGAGGGLAIPLLQRGGLGSSPPDLSPGERASGATGVMDEAPSTPPAHEAAAITLHCHPYHHTDSSSQLSGDGLLAVGGGGDDTPCLLTVALSQQQEGGRSSARSALPALGGSSGGALGPAGASSSSTQVSAAPSMTLVPSSSHNNLLLAHSACVASLHHSDRLASGTSTALLLLSTTTPSTATPTPSTSAAQLFKQPSTVLQQQQQQRESGVGDAGTLPALPPLVMLPPLASSGCEAAVADGAEGGDPPASGAPAAGASRAAAARPAAVGPPLGPAPQCKPLPGPALAATAMHRFFSCANLMGAGGCVGVVGSNDDSPLATVVEAGAVAESVVAVAAAGGKGMGGVPSSPLPLESSLLLPAMSQSAGAGGRAAGRACCAAREDHRDEGLEEGEESGEGRAAAAIETLRPTRSRSIPSSCGTTGAAAAAMTDAAEDVLLAGAVGNSGDEAGTSASSSATPAAGSGAINGSSSGALSVLSSAGAGSMMVPMSSGGGHGGGLAAASLALTRAAAAVAATSPISSTGGCTSDAVQAVRGAVLAAAALDLSGAATTVVADPAMPGAMAVGDAPTKAAGAACDGGGARPKGASCLPSLALASASTAALLAAGGTGSTSNTARTLGGVLDNALVLSSSSVASMAQQLHTPKQQHPAGAWVAERQLLAVAQLQPQPATVGAQGAAAGSTAAGGQEADAAAALGLQGPPAGLQGAAAGRGPQEVDQAEMAALAQAARSLSTQQQQLQQLQQATMAGLAGLAAAASSHALSTPPAPGACSVGHSSSSGHLPQLSSAATAPHLSHHMQHHHTQHHTAPGRLTVGSLALNLSVAQQPFASPLPQNTGGGGGHHAEGSSYHHLLSTSQSAPPSARPLYPCPDGWGSVAPMPLDPPPLALAAATLPPPQLPGSAGSSQHAIAAPPPAPTAPLAPPGSTGSSGSSSSAGGSAATAPAQAQHSNGGGMAAGQALPSAGPSSPPAGGVTLSLKIPGVHWWFRSRSHAAELTAGYYNTATRDGYAPLVELCARFGVALTLTCVEMCDGQHPQVAACSPEGLLKQIRALTARHSVQLSGENALPIFLANGVDTVAMERIVINTRAWYGPAAYTGATRQHQALLLAQQQQEQQQQAALLQHVRSSASVPAGSGGSGALAALMSGSGGGAAAGGSGMSLHASMQGLYQHHQNLLQGAGGSGGGALTAAGGGVYPSTQLPVSHQHYPAYHSVVAGHGVLQQVDGSYSVAGVMLPPPLAAPQQHLAPPPGQQGSGAPTLVSGGLSGPQHAPPALQGGSAWAANGGLAWGYEHTHVHATRPLGAGLLATHASSFQAAAPLPLPSPPHEPPSALQGAPPLPCAVPAAQSHTSLHQLAHQHHPAVAVAAGGGHGPPVATWGSAPTPLVGGSAAGGAVAAHSLALMSPCSSLENSTHGDAQLALALLAGGGVAVAHHSQQQPPGGAGGLISVLSEFVAGQLPAGAALPTQQLQHVALPVGGTPLMGPVAAAAAGSCGGGDQGGGGMALPSQQVLLEQPSSSDALQPRAHALLAGAWLGGGGDGGGLGVRASSMGGLGFGGAQAGDMAWGLPGEQRGVTVCGLRTDSYADIHEPLPAMRSFTFLRLGPELLLPKYQAPWMRFMSGMQQGGYAPC